MSEYLTQDGKIAYVGTATFTGHYTFYIREAKKPNQRSQRIKVRKQQIYFDTKAEAETTLADYARGRGWKHV